jgi:hypothetical protein
MNNSIDYHMATATFRVNLEASSDKSTYKGMFKVKCVLSPLEYISSDAFYRELLGKHNPQFASEYVSQLCYALSQLKYRVIDAPDWFYNKETGISGSSIDDNILLFVLDKAVEIESEYREGMEKKYKEAKEEVIEAIDSGNLTNGDEELNDIDDEE